MTRLRAPKANPEPAPINDAEEAAEAKEFDALRLRVWRIRRRRVKLMGRLYIAGGLAALAVGYLTHYFGLEVVSAIMIPLGAFFALEGNEPYVKSSVAGQSVISAMRVLQEALKANSEQGHAVFVPVEGDQRSVTMFIPASDLPDGEVSTEGVEGHYYTPLGHELFADYLKEVGGRTEHDLMRTLEQLREIMTAGLDMVEDIRFEVKLPVISAQIRNASFAEIGKFPGLVSGVYAKAGCPVTNSMAEWVSYCTGTPVRWLDAQVNPVDRVATVKLFWAGGKS